MIDYFEDGLEPNIAIYFSVERFCDDTRKCMGGHSPNRHRLLVAIVHVYRFLKGSAPFDPSPIYLTRNEWFKTMQKVNDLFPNLKLFTALSRSGRFSTFNELVEEDFLHKIPDPNDGRGYLFAVNLEKMACAACIVQNQKL